MRGRGENKTGQKRQEGQVKADQKGSRQVGKTGKAGKALLHQRLFDALGGMMTQMPSSPVDTSALRDWTGPQQNIGVISTPIGCEAMLQILYGADGSAHSFAGSGSDIFSNYSI